MDIKAQDEVVLTSVSAEYPNERPQWTKADGAAWQEKYGPIIGINHPQAPYPNMSRKDCLRKVKELGFNSVRMFISGSTADSYIANVRSYAADCEEFGLTLSPVFTFPQTCYANANKAIGLKTLENIVRKVVQAFRGDDRIILWDIWNEPVMTDETATIEVMDWIKQMVVWCRQEGCTQPITCSIVWDAGISAASSTSTLMRHRNEAESMMDLHNFHDYSCEEDHSRNISVMVERLKKLGDVPLVCTEALTRTNGSGVARSLAEFSKYHINFYTWGLYACDSPWHVRWDRSAYYAWEPMFHNLLYSDGDPYDESELPWFPNFKFAEEDEVVDPGAEYTECWSPRRAWKWLSRSETKGLHYSSLTAAIEGVSQHASDGLYSSVNVDISLQDYINNTSLLYSRLNSLLTAANAAGMTVLPTLLSGADLGRNYVTVRDYVYTLIGRYYYDRRILGWEIFRQKDASDADNMTSVLPKLMRYVCYDFPNQPMFMSPLVTDATELDPEGTDAANLAWRLSDVIGYTTAEGTTLSDEWRTKVHETYSRPQFQMLTEGIAADFAKHHVNWFASAEVDAEAVKDFAYLPATQAASSDGRWEGWKSWMWMNRGETKGLYFTSVSAALAGVEKYKDDGTYNSLRVLLEYADYAEDTEAFFAAFDELLSAATEAGMTVLPALIANKYLSSNTDEELLAYVSQVVGRYAKQTQILAWDLLFSPTNSGTARVMALVPQLFSAARAADPVQPLFMTPSVSVKTLPEDYLILQNHSHGSGGWNYFNYTGGATAALLYLIWCQSDVIAYASTQQSIPMGWVASIAYRFGRPLFCSQWRTTVTETATNSLAIFSDLHVNWYVDGEARVDADDVKNFKFQPVSTQH